MLVQHTVHQSMIRPHQFKGGDREMTFVLMMQVAGLALVGQSYLTTGIAIALWIGGMWALRQMAKSDPLMRHVYLRHITYKRYVPALSTPWRANSSGQTRHYRIEQK